jgi:hypothetical protein
MNIYLVILWLFLFLAASVQVRPPPPFPTMDLKPKPVVTAPTGTPLTWTISQMSTVIFRKSFTLSDGSIGAAAGQWSDHLRLADLHRKYFGRVGN